MRSTAVGLELITHTESCIYAVCSVLPFSRNASRRTASRIDPFRQDARHLHRHEPGLPHVARYQDIIER